MDFTRLTREQLISCLEERDDSEGGGIRLTYKGQTPPWRIVRRVRPRRQKIETDLCVGDEADQDCNLIVEGENLQANGQPLQVSRPGRPSAHRPAVRHAKLSVTSRGARPRALRGAARRGKRKGEAGQVLSAGHRTAGTSDPGYCPASVYVMERKTEPMAEAPDKREPPREPSRTLVLKTAGPCQAWDAGKGADRTEACGYRLRACLRRVMQMGFCSFSQLRRCA